MKEHHGRDMGASASKALEFAQSVLKRETWTPTPLLPAASAGSKLGSELWLKREALLNPSRRGNRV